MGYETFPGVLDLPDLSLTFFCMTPVFMFFRSNIPTLLECTREPPFPAKSKSLSENNCFEIFFFFGLGLARGGFIFEFIVRNNVLFDFNI
jgi:hypothetical protein